MTITETTAPMPLGPLAADIAGVTAAWFHCEPTELLSVARCIDWLLDLHQATRRPDLRRLIAEVIEDLRMLGEIDEPATEDLVIGALASVEAALEIAGVAS